MKKLLFLFTFALAANSLLAQGSVNFNTQLVGPTARVQFFGSFLAGTNYFAQLYAGASSTDDSAFSAIGIPVNFRSGVNAGYVQTSGTTSLGQAVDPVVTVPGTTEVARSANLQMRAWSAPFRSYEATRAGGGFYGKTPILTLNVTFPPSVPPTLVGLQGFAFLGCPEPSTYALSLLGAAALLCRLRRRK